MDEPEYKTSMGATWRRDMYHYALKLEAEGSQESADLLRKIILADAEAEFKEGTRQ